MTAAPVPRRLCNSPGLTQAIISAHPLSRELCIWVVPDKLMIWLYSVRPSTMCTSSDSTRTSFEASLVDFLTTTYVLQMEYIIKLVDVRTQYGKHGVLLTAREKVGIDAGTEIEKNLFHELYYHLLNTDQSEDVLCWRSLQHPQWFSQAEVTLDGQYLLLSIEEGCDPANRLYYFDLTTLPHGFEGFKGSNMLLPFKKLVDNFDAQYQLLANDKSVFTFLTNNNAPRYKLTRVNLNYPSAWTDVIPESKTEVLVSADFVDLQHLLVCYMSDVKHQLQVHDLQTGSLLHQLHLEIGSDNEEEFRWLIKYSPLHNVRWPWEQMPGVQYLPTMLSTADHDDHVVPLHSLKLLATLQYELCTSLESSPQTNPLIARIDTKAGHGAGCPTQKVIDEISDAYSFFAMVTNTNWVD